MSKSKKHDWNRRAAREIGVPNFRWSGRSAQDLRAQRRQEHKRQGWRDELAWYLRHGYQDSTRALWLVAQIGEG